MSNRDRFDRQTAVDTHTVAALTGAATGPSSVMRDLVEQELAAERERARKHPRRPAEARRQGRRTNITFSDETVLVRLKDLARRWELYTNNGLPAVSKTVEHLLLPQLRKAEAGEIDPPNADAHRQGLPDVLQGYIDERR